MYRCNKMQTWQKICIAFTAWAVISACKKTSQPPPVGIFARINNVPWTATQYRGEINTGITGSHTVEWTEVFGSDSTSNTNFQKLAMSVSDAKTGISALGFSIYSDNNRGVFFGDGAIIFTLISTTNIQGTFRFNSDSVVITDGTFNVPVQ
jgi:hypothetical protein